MLFHLRFFTGLFWAIISRCSSCPRGSLTSLLLAKIPLDLKLCIISMSCNLFSWATGGILSEFPWVMSEKFQQSPRENPTIVSGGASLHSLQEFLKKKSERIERIFFMNSQRIFFGKFHEKQREALLKDLLEKMLEIPEKHLYNNLKEFLDKVFSETFSNFWNFRKFSEFSEVSGRIHQWSSGTILSEAYKSIPSISEWIYLETFGNISQINFQKNCPKEPFIRSSE